MDKIQAGDIHLTGKQVDDETVGEFDGIGNQLTKVSATGLNTLASHYDFVKQGCYLVKSNFRINAFFEQRACNIQRPNQ
ncbi:MAG: hypothetical protein JAZ11_04090 [Candidatus Thiodiazotropha lotti]|nr:hypothetical protein [Candidatus Thiodiazotropha lotti]